MQPRYTLTMNDFVYSSKIETVLKIIVIMIYTSLAIALARVGVGYGTSGTLNPASSVHEIIAMVIALAMYTFISRRSGQFIQWTEEEVLFKAGGIEGTIPVRMIRKIQIEEEKIIIMQQNGCQECLDLSDFNNYKTRLRIKSNFSKLSGMLNEGRGHRSNDRTAK